MIADSSFSNKSRFGLSFAGRIILICLVFLLIPLLIQNFIIYRHDEKAKERTLQLSLAIYAKGQAALLQQKMSATGFGAEKAFESLPQYAPFSGRMTLLDSNGQLVAGTPITAGEIRVQIPINGYSLVVSTTEEALSHIPETGLTTHLWRHFFIVLLIGIVATVFFARRLARPMSALHDTMQRVEQGHLHVRYLRDRWGFEINAIGSHFNRMIDAVLAHMEEARTERVKREVLSNELKIGHEIQKTILPKVMPELPGVELAAHFIPAKEVAGDFYDVLAKDSRLMLAVADTCGKGISACLYSLCVRSMLRSYEDALTDLPDIIRATNNLFLQDTGDSGFFVTAWVGLYDALQKRLHFTSCGHPAALLRRADGRIEELATEGTALGVTKFATVSALSVELRPGDTVVLYTDGITEAVNEQKKFFGKERLKALIQKESTAKDVIDKIFKEVGQFTSGNPIQDDMTVVVMKV